MNKKRMDIQCLLSSHIDDYSDDDREDMEDALEALGWLSVGEIAGIDTSSRCPVTVAAMINSL